MLFITSNQNNCKIWMNLFVAIEHCPAISGIEELMVPVFKCRTFTR